MAKFKITPTTTVAELKEQFRNEVGCVLRVYQGRSEAPDGATLVSLGAKEGELECRTSRTVGKFEEALQNELNLKVKVYTKDNWVKVLDGITLAVAGQLPNGMTKAKMEEHLSYKRDEQEEDSTCLSNTDKQEEDDSSDLEELTEEIFEKAKFLNNIIVVMTKIHAKNIEELHKKVREGDYAAIVTRIGDVFNYLGDNCDDSYVYQDEDINFDELYLIYDLVDKLENANFDDLSEGVYLPEGTFSYYNGEGYPDEDNAPCFVVAEELTGDHTGHVWGDIWFRPHKIFVCNGKILARR